MLNKVILIGRLANDPEPKYTPSGIAVTTFRLAVDRPISAEARQSGQEKQADFIDIVAWRQQAEFACNYLGKGRLVAIDGRLQIRQYVAQDGTNRRVAEVVVDQLKSLERPRDSQGEGAGDFHSGGGYRAANGNGSQDSGYSSSQGSEAPARKPYTPRTASAPAANRPAGASVDASTEIDPFADDLDDPFVEP
jgi:single-strand DNA-binding protein